MRAPCPLALAGGAAILTFAAAAAAQPSADQRAAAAALFEDGKRLMAEGKLAEACPKLAESQNLDPGMGTLFNLALCHEKSGRTASAWVGYREVAAMAKAAGQADREKVAHDKEAALEPKLTRLRITLKPGATGVAVKRDGAPVSPAILGTGVPVDPGKHVVSASAPGKDPWEASVTVDQPGQVVTVEVPPLAEKKAAPATPPPAIAPLAPPAAPPPDAPAPRSWQRPVGFTAIGLGAVGLGLGTAFGFMAKSAQTTSNTSGNCDAQTNICNQAGVDQRAGAVNKGNAGTGLFIAGAVLAAGGVVLVATAPSHPAKAALTVGPGSVSVRASF